MNGMVDDAVTSFRDRINAAIAQFDERARALDQAEADLWAAQDTVVASGDDALLAEWAAAVDRVNATQASVQSVKGQISSVVEWWARIKSSLGIGNTDGMLSGLGLIEGIPWGILALIMGGTAAIAATLYAVGLVIDKVRRYRYQIAVDEAVANGTPIPPDVPPPATGGGLLDTLAGVGNSAVWIIGGLIILAVLPKIRGQ